MILTAPPFKLKVIITCQIYTLSAGHINVINVCKTHNVFVRERAGGGRERRKLICGGQCRCCGSLQEKNEQICQENLM